MTRAAAPGGLTLGSSSLHQPHAASKKTPDPAPPNHLAAGPTAKATPLNI